MTSSDRDPRPGLAALLDLRALFLGVAFAAMWASAYTAARAGIFYAAPLYLLTFRLAAAGLIAVVVARWRGPMPRLSGREWRNLALFGVCQNTLTLGLFFFAMQEMEASMASVIASMLPLFVALASTVFLGERPAPLAVIGLIVGFGGVLLILVARLEQGADGFGILLGFLAIGALTVATLVLRNTGSARNMLMIVGLQMLVGSAATLPLALIFDDWRLVPSPTLAMAFAYMVLVASLLATLTWFSLVERIGPTRAATFHFLNPFFGVVAAWLVLGEPITLRDLVGVAIIMAGILAVQVSRSRAVRT